MARQRNSTPTYRLHKSSGQAVSDFWDVSGKKRTVSLGAWQSPESKQAHARLCAEVAAGRPTGPTDGMTVNELCLVFLRHAAAHYRRPDGTPTDELANVKYTVKVLRETHGDRPAAEFGPLALKAVRDAMVSRGWCRRNVNMHTGRVRRIFRHGVENEMVPPSVLEGLKAVTGLQAGRTAAREMPPVLPVDPADVTATMPFLNRHVRGIVEFQRLTGCRPGEACSLRWADIDTTADVWVYRPRHHKNAHRGKGRSIAVGPKCQALLAWFAASDNSGFVFSPRRERAERMAARAAARKTKVYGEKKATKTAPERSPGEGYTVASYGYAVRRAVVKANGRRKRLANGAEFDPVPAWHPNQLRHLRATEARKRFGLEAAQVILGHAKADVTQIYAEKNYDLAATVASAIG